MIAQLLTYKHLKDVEDFLISTKINVRNLKRPDKTVVDKNIRVAFK